MHKLVDEVHVANGAAYRLAVLVEHARIDVRDRLVKPFDVMSKQIDVHHVQRLVSERTVLDDETVVLALVLLGKVLAEAHDLGREPRLLKLDVHVLHCAVRLADLRAEVYAENSDVAVQLLDVVVVAHRDLDNLALEHVGQYDARRAVVGHQKLEHRVVYGVCYYCCHNK